MISKVMSIKPVKTDINMYILIFKKIPLNYKQISHKFIENTMQLK